MKTTEAVLVLLCELSCNSLHPRLKTAAEISEPVQTGPIIKSSQGSCHYHCLRHQDCQDLGQGKHINDWTFCYWPPHLPDKDKCTRNADLQRSKCFCLGSLGLFNHGVPYKVCYQKNLSNCEKSGGASSKTIVHGSVLKILRALAKFLSKNVNGGWQANDDINISNKAWRLTMVGSTILNKVW